MALSFFRILYIVYDERQTKEMLIMDLKKMQNLSEAFIEKFKESATELVMDEVTNTDDDNRKTIIMFTARDMAIGAMIKRNENIAIGIGIGVGITALTFIISSKLINKKKDDIIDITFEEILESETEITDNESEEIDDESIENEKPFMDNVNDILKKPSSLKDLKSAINKLKDNDIT
jgi:hypothetical protein